MQAEWVGEFGRTVTAKFASGEGQPEDHLRGPFEQLLARAAEALGVGLVLAGESRLSDLSIRPDYAVLVDGALIGHVELKSPDKGADPTRFRTEHDRDQWERLKSLPNVLYCSGGEWALFRDGERVGPFVRVDGDVTRDGGQVRVDLAQLGALLETFLQWQPLPPRRADDLAMTAARLCRLLRAEVLELLASDDSMQALAADWRELLFPDADDERFADGYAQTVTFALLLARVEKIDFGDGAIAPIARELDDSHGLIGTALSLLTDDRVVDQLATSVNTLVRVMSVVDWEAISTGDRDTWLLFYEDFLQEYDPALRRESGSYYTPNQVVDAMVRMTDDIVRSRLGRPRGLADDTVTIIDPATGTGTFLFRIIDRIATTVEQLEGPGAVPGQLQAAADRLIGFELQTGPFAVAELRLNEEFRQRGAALPADRLRLYVANTLDNPYIEAQQLRGVYRALGRSRQAANRVKVDEHVLVCIGNPPYAERSKGDGGWIEQGNPDAGQSAPLDAWKPPADWGVSPHVKHLYNPYVYFWRWATWKVFDHHPDATTGVVAFITVAGFLNGPGFQAMRDYLRRTCSEIWVIDLTPEGHQPPVSSRPFEGVQQPICIAIAVRDGTSDPSTPATVRYHQLAPGLRRDKFAELAQLDVDGQCWDVCGEGWRDPFLPAPEETWSQLVALEDLLPWSGSGTMPGRIWPISPDPDTLRARWRALIKEDDADRKRTLLKEHSRDRRIDTELADDLPGFPPPTRTIAAETEVTPRLERIAYRSFDEQWIVADKRVINQPNPALWHVRGDRQVYLTAPHRTAPTSGPAATFSARPPDLDHYKGSFGGRAYPLWRDPEATAPNLPPGLLRLLQDRFGVVVDADDVFAYLAAVLANPAYPARFADDLLTPGLRVPVTSDGAVFDQAVELGREVIWLHTRGQRYADRAAGRPPGPPRAPDGRWPRVDGDAPIPGDPGRMPATISYDEETETLHVGEGRIADVPPAVWAYEISGTHVLRKWFGYRQADPEGRRSSPLDDINPTAWPATYTSDLIDLLHVLIRLVDLEPDLARLLDRILGGGLLSVDELTDAGVLPVPDTARRKPTVPPWQEQATLL